MLVLVLDSITGLWLLRRMSHCAVNRLRLGIGGTIMRLLMWRMLGILGRKCMLVLWAVMEGREEGNRGMQGMQKGNKDKHKERDIGIA